NFHGCRAQQRPVDSIETSEGWTRRAALRPFVSRSAELRVQFGVAGLEQPDQRTGRQGGADRLHFREPRAAAEDVEEGGGLARRLLELRVLVENDAPGDGGEEQQDEQNDLPDEAAFENQRKDIDRRRRFG